MNPSLKMHTSLKSDAARGGGCVTISDGKVYGRHVSRRSCVQFAAWKGKGLCERELHGELLSSVIRADVKPDNVAAISTVTSGTQGSEYSIAWSLILTKAVLTAGKRSKTRCSPLLPNLLPSTHHPSTKCHSPAFSRRPLTSFPPLHVSNDIDVAMACEAR